MSKYETPKCNCGEPLIYSTEKVFLVEKKISNSGRVSKRTKKTNISELGTYDTTGLPIEKLLCNKCLLKYECEYDSKNRAIRGHIL